MGVLAVTVRDALWALTLNATRTDVSACQASGTEGSTRLREVALEALEEQLLPPDGRPEIVSFMAHGD